MLARELAQVDGLGVGVQDVAQHAAGQHAIVDLQRVGVRAVQLQALAQPVGEEGEAARHQQHLDAGGLRGADQPFGARIQPQLFRVDLFQRLGRHALEQRDAAAQAFGEVLDLAAHGGFGDFRHLVLTPATPAISSMHSMLISVESMSMASTLQLDSFRPAGRKVVSMPLLSPGADLGAGGVIVLHVEQAGGGGADAGHALGLGQRGQLLRLVDGQGRDWTTR